MKRFLFVIALPICALVLAACAAPAQPAPGPETAGGASINAGSLTINDPWVRPAVIEGGNGAAYMRIINTGEAEDALIGVSADFAQTVELHETMMMGDGMEDMDESMEGMDHSEDMAMMAPVEAIPVPAGGEAQLAPGGYHVMLIGIAQPPAEGDTVELTLTFRETGEITVEAPVRLE